MRQILAVYRTSHRRDGRAFPRTQELPYTRKGRHAAFGGIATEAELAMALILSPEIRIVCSLVGMSPVPSITRKCSSATTGACMRMKSFIWESKASIWLNEHGAQEPTSYISRKHRTPSRAARKTIVPFIRGIVPTPFVHTARCLTCQICLLVGITVCTNGMTL